MTARDSQVTVNESLSVFVEAEHSDGSSTRVEIADVDATIAGLMAARRQVAAAEGIPQPAPWPRDGVYRIGAGEWMVPSDSVEGAFRHVAYGHNPTLGNHMLCSCPAGKARGPMGGGHERPCRHVLEVGRAEQADGLAERPKARLVAARFVE